METSAGLGFGLLESFWKTIKCIDDGRLNVNDCLHGFVKKRGGCGTTGIEAKLLQQLSYLKPKADTLVWDLY